jgi:hypothetical protein
VIRLRLWRKTRPACLWRGVVMRVPKAVLVVQRYDRNVTAAGVQSLHQIDGCQLLGHGSGWKCERQAGLVTLAKLCADCGFSTKETLRELKAFHAKLLPT